MKKMMTILAAMAAMAAAAELRTVQLVEGETVSAGLGASQAVAARAMSTNATGTVTIKRVAAFEHGWYEYAPVTNILKKSVNNVQRRTVTNDVVTAWITNRINSTTVQSNFWARAINETPTNHPYANIVYVTNRVEAVEDVTNIVTEVVTGTNVTLGATWRTARIVVTNELATLSLSGGFAETNLADRAIMPGDEVFATGTPMKGGRILLLMRK